MSGYTKGPWDIQESTGWDEAWCDWHQVGPVSLMGPRADADSHLIAAAPDLLEALIAMLPESNADEKHCRPDFETCEHARSAISKAIGEVK